MSFDTEGSLYLWSSLIDIEANMQVREAMIPRSKLITASPSISVVEAMDILVVNRIGSLVITDNDDKVVGIVTARDLMRAIVVNQSEGANQPINEIMSLKLLTIHENDKLENAVIKMEEYTTHHILVRNNSGTITGILSSFDIVKEASLTALKIT